MVDWITLSQTAGTSGDTTVTVGASVYTGTTTRTTTLTVENDNTHLSKTVNILQEPREIITISVSPSFISVPTSGGVYVFNVLSNGNWEVYSINSNITLSQSAGTGNVTVTATVAASSSLTDRNMYIRFRTLDNTASLRFTQERAKQTISVYPTELTYIYDGGSKTITVTSNGYWTATTEEWITLSATAGTGTTTITATADPHQGDRKSGTIKFETVDSVAYVSVTQYGVLPYLEFDRNWIEYLQQGGTEILRTNSNIEWEIELLDNIDVSYPITTDVSSLSISTTGGTSIINIETDYKWRIVDVPDWITVSEDSGIGDAAITVVVDTNLGDTVRTCNLVFETITSSATVSVTQYFAGIVVSPSSMVVYSTGTSEFVQVQCMLRWSASTTSDWITLSQTAGSGNTFVTVNVAVNTGATNKTGTVEFVCENGKRSSLSVVSISPYIEKPLTFEIQSDGDIILYTINTSSAVTLEYSKNGGEWTSITSTTGVGASISVVSGDTVQFKGNNNSYGYNSVSASTCSYKLSGNIMSLLNSNNYVTATTLNKSLERLFEYCTGVTDARKLQLPATTLSAQYCYRNMFRNCTNLTAAPELPATTLARYCYDSMFEGCSALTTAPSILPATTLIANCYMRMFRYCYSLTTAPELPATTLPYMCYFRMFQDCTNLNYIKCLATDIYSAESTTFGWTESVAPTGTFVKNPSATGWHSGEDGIPSNWTVYDDGSEPDYTTMPLTFEITGNGNLVFRANNTNAILTVEYKKNNGDWIEITTSTGETAPSIPVVNGDTVQFRGNNETYAVDVYGYNTFADSTCSFNVEGNIMSLINSTNFSGLTTLTSAYTFYYLFRYCTGLTDASNLVLPATTLTDDCYEYMFYHCDNLTTVPSILPATTLASYCYYAMFSNCSSLVRTPVLPATTLADNCYYNMFNSCTSLINIPPLLPATTLTSHCYQYMFSGCTSLTTILSEYLPSTMLQAYCYRGMFMGCTGLTSAPALPATSLTPYCYESMFRGCTSLTQAPVLPATTLVNYCYQNMYSGCTSLNAMECLARDISATNCTNYWVRGVQTDSGTFIKNIYMNDWSRGQNGVPENWTIMNRG